MTAPRGKGMYVRDGDTTFARAVETCNFVCLHRASSRRGERAARARELGKTVYLYSLIGSWTPDKWRGELAAIEAEARRMGAEGFLCDPEGGWSGHFNEAEDLGEACAKIAETGLSVGVTSYPSWGGRAALLRGIGSSGVWVSPQCYFKDTAWGDLKMVRQWIDAWGASGADVVPSVSLWQWESVPSTPDAWRRYFESFGVVRGAIGWPTSGPSGTILEAWKAFSPSPVPDAIVAEVAALERFTGMTLGEITAILGSVCAVLLVAFFALR